MKSGHKYDDKWTNDQLTDSCFIKNTKRRTYKFKPDTKNPFLFQLESLIQRRIFFRFHNFSLVIL